MANAPRRRGVASILAMLYLVIFASLAAAMAIVAQGNLSTADAHLKINRSLAAAETGMQFITARLAQVSADIKTTDGLIDASNAPDLWAQARDAMYLLFLDEPHCIAPPVINGESLTIGPIAVGPEAPTFVATLTPHPIVSENYNSAYYARPPYSQMATPVSNDNPLDASWIRVVVTASDGPPNRAITRSIQVDFRITKKINFAILSRSRVMIGRNVSVEGTVGSTFTETNLTNGHPIQIQSDFRGLNADLDAALDALVNTLAENDQDHDNRINLANSLETEDLDDPQQWDTNNDGYVDEYDFFLSQFDTNDDGEVSAGELDAENNVAAAQLLAMIDTTGNPNRIGYGDGLISEADQYAKLHGQIKLKASLDAWEIGAANGPYQNYLQGPIDPDHNKDALTASSQDSTFHEYTPDDFNTSSLKDLATGDLAEQADEQFAQHDPDDPDSPGGEGEVVTESVPYQAAHPYDYYDRPVYRNMTFTNLKIPQGSNALFVNCRFIGITYVETMQDNDDPNFNYVGMKQENGDLKYPDMKIINEDDSEILDTKTVSNNIRFENCTFEGAIVSDTPGAYTHVRNKMAFTGRTRFEIEDSANLTETEKQLYRRSTILTPQFSIEMGSFDAPSDENETVNLSGTIVAGILDIRGQVDINGAVVTTFEPHSGVGPVMGDTSPQFNTTLGYFGADQGDMESEIPIGGVGRIHVRYDPDIPMPDGINAPIQIEPVMSTYFEGAS